MNDSRLAELREKYKDRNLLEELAWGMYHNHSGYMSKTHGEFLNWLCNAAYMAIKEQQPMRKKGRWIDTGGMEEWWAKEFKCSECGESMLGKANYCHNCGAEME